MGPLLLLQSWSGVGGSAGFDTATPTNFLFFTSLSSSGAMAMTPSVVSPTSGGSTKQNPTPPLNAASLLSGKKGGRFGESSLFPCTDPQSHTQPNLHSFGQLCLLSLRLLAILPPAKARQRISAVTSVRTKGGAAEWFGPISLHYVPPE
uniref:Secreted protein n=1 Tax=Pyxicephalus adspersus TaxID=30357 RepID=A0AAV3AXM7_PYXAD|nr:TPA: hypothetical protein GDO54_005937 [Pyxicephalus adspersus]